MMAHARFFPPAFFRWSFPVVFLGAAGCKPQSPAPSPQIAGEALRQWQSERETPPEKLGFSRVLGVLDAVQTKAGLRVPAGFDVQILARDLAPRRLAIAPGANANRYELWVNESFANRVSILTIQAGKARARRVFAANLERPYGLAFWKNTVFVATPSAIWRFSRSNPQSRRKIATLPSQPQELHWTRNLAVSPDGKRLMVAIGSTCDSCEEPGRERAAILSLDLDGSNRKIWARGLRNPVGLAFRPGTNELWAVVNERNKLGDDTPPDYFTRLREGCFYGWPYAYTSLGRTPISDPQWGAKQPDYVRATTLADVPFQAHSAPLGLAFYPEKGGNFPPEFRGDAFLALHGSKERSQKTGFKILRVDFRGGQPRVVSDFASGFLKPNGQVWGRPVDIVAAPDGSLLFSDDKGGKIWRIFRKKR